MPNQSTVGEKKVLDDDIPFGISHEQIVDIPVDLRGFNNLYIDFLVSLTVSIDDNASRMARSSMLAIHSAACLINENEPISREVMEAMNKHLAEAAPEEIKVIIG